MDRLSPLDASFLHIEDDVNHMHIGSVSIFEGPIPPRDALTAMIAGKLPLVPRYRQRIREVPLTLGRPVWVADPHFSLDYHLRFSALPSPGGVAQLRDLTSRVMSQKLDLTKPLWEMWAVEGLEDDRWALVSKVHHAMVDGVSGTDLLAVVLDADPTAQPPEPEDDWAPPPPPSTIGLVAASVRDAVVSPFEQWRIVRSAVRRPVRAARTLGENVRGLTAMRGLARPGAASSLVGPIGPHRRYAWAQASLDDVRVVRSALGGTVNDVVLTAITGGFRDLLLAQGEDPTGRSLRSLIPVSVRRPDERGTYNNRVSAMFAELPVSLDDPVERLASIRTELQGLKESHQAVAAETLTSLSGFAPALLLALGMRVAFRSFQRLGRGAVDTVTTNVPGPQQPLYALGRQMLSSYPYVPLASPVRVGVAIFSYQGQLTFGITGDRDSIGNVAVLADGIEASLAALVDAARAVTAQ